MHLTGTVDGIEISFDFIPPNTFRGVVPKKLNGRYIISLQLADEAGNKTSNSDIYMYLDFQKMKFKILDKYKIVENGVNMGYMECTPQYSYREVM